MMIYLHVSEWYHQHNPNFNGGNRQKSQLRFIVAGVHWLLYWWSFMIHDMSPAKEFALGQLTHDSASANWLSWVISLHRGEMSMGELFRGRAVWSQKKIVGNLLNAHEPSARDWFQWTSDENREMSTERTAARVKSFPFCGWVGHNFRMKLYRDKFY